MNHFEIYKRESTSEGGSRALALSHFNAGCDDEFMKCSSREEIIERAEEIRVQYDIQKGTREFNVLVAKASSHGLRYSR